MNWDAAWILFAAAVLVALVQIYIEVFRAHPGKTAAASVATVAALVLFGPSSEWWQMQIFGLKIY